MNLHKAVPIKITHKIGNHVSHSFFNYFCLNLILSEKNVIYYTYNQVLEIYINKIYLKFKNSTVFSLNLKIFNPTYLNQLLQFFFLINAYQRTRR